MSWQMSWQKVKVLTSLGKMHQRNNILDLRSASLCFHEKRSAQVRTPNSPGTPCNPSATLPESCLKLPQSQFWADSSFDDMPCVVHRASRLALPTLRIPTLFGASFGIRPLGTEWRGAIETRPLVARAPAARGPQPLSIIQ